MNLQRVLLGTPNIRADWSKTTWNALCFLSSIFTMSLFRNETKLEDALRKRMLISHDPDDRRIDSEHLLYFVESMLLSDNTSSSSSVSEVKCLSDFELIAAHEPLGHIISNASHHILCASNKERDLSSQVMALFDLLAHYTWDAKVVLVLAAFAMTWGEIWLVNKLYHKIPLAASVSDLRQIPKNPKELHQRFKALSSLFKILTDLTKSIIRLCAMPTQHIPLDDEILKASLANTQIHAAAYWVIKATLICSSKVTHLVSSKSEPAIWELTSLASRISSVCNDLKHNVETCERNIELKLRRRLKNLRNEVHDDNQEVLKILLGMHDDFPLKTSALQHKPKGLSVLKNKIVLLLVSSPNLNAETLVLLTDKLYHHPKLTDDLFEIVWVPIDTSTSWSETDKRSFSFISKAMPWWSIRRPWKLNRAVVEYITQVLDFKGQPVMPVLDKQGSVVNSDALSMALVWGAEAFPFSDAREFELWQNANWNVKFLLNDLDPLVSTWIEEGINLCIFGGNDTEWIEQVSSKMKAMIDRGLQVKIIYLGQKNLREVVNTIFRSSGRKNRVNISLVVTGLEFFWPRIKSLRRSKLRTPGANRNDDMIIHQLQKLLDLKCGKDGWTILGATKDEIKILQGMEVMEFLTRVSEGHPHPPPEPQPPSSPKAGPCGHFKAVAYTEELVGQKIICDHCHRTMEMFFISE